MKAELCPVCRGSGVYPAKLTQNNFLGPFQPTNISSPQPQQKQNEQQPQKKCHGCDGKGWIVVPSDRHDDFSPPKHYPKDKPYDPFGPFGDHRTYRIGDPPRRRWGDNIWCSGYTVKSSVRFQY